MGYFSQKFGIKSFNEAEADGEDLTDNNSQPTEYTEPDNVNQTEEKPTDNTQTDTEDNTQQDQQPEDNVDNPIEDETPDYTEIGNESDPIEGEESTSDENDNQDNQPVDDLKAQEEEILGLTPEQLNVKHGELKSLFLKLYDSTNTVIDRIGNISVNSMNASVINFISKNLADLRTMIIDYLDNIYSGKSYTENAITYNRFVSVLYGINKMLEELGKNND